MKEITSDEYYNKVFGSWLGRVAGDFVGAPVEFVPYATIKEKYGTITNYPEPINLEEVNDDEMYEICALVALEKHGINLTAKNIAQEWVDLLYDKNFTAEKVALENLRKGIWPPESGKNNNFWFDAIGAQMRADIWGLITPGCPDIAKQYAEMDGSISHAGVGIEGEVYVAALISNAFFESDIRKNIDMALKYIPAEENSLYTQMIKKALDLYKLYPNDFRKAGRDLISYWNQVKKEKLKITGVTGSMRESRLAKKRKNQFFRLIAGVHVLPNIGIIILSLLYGAKDEDPLGRSICIAAMMGLDTDCNCGNIGTIIGVQLGADKIPSKWKDPLQDTFNTYVKGYENWKISELARRITNVGLKVIEEKGQGIVKIIDQSQNKI